MEENQDKPKKKKDMERIATKKTELSPNVLDKMKKKILKTK